MISLVSEYLNVVFILQWDME